ncbi:MAG TPA: sulfurtransferase [Solirubrobacteraceae bacterium]|nr:sulfurtransferase [Solirubrobacteraceae bacterium]
MSLITASELHDAPRPALLDVRWELGGPPGRDLYLDGHIPGAVFVDLDTALAGPPGAGGRHPLPDADTFAHAMRAAGVSADRPVVVYDAGNSIAAARAWWLLRYFGHSDVRVLDGGFSGWLAAGFAIERAVTSPEAGDFVARPGGMPLLDAESAATVARDGVLLDARAPERFRGEREPVDPVAGHIPGAVNLPAPELAGGSGRFLDADALGERFAEAGVRAGEPIGAYCGSGVAAAFEVLALSLAGIPSALYVGSWSDWITDPGRPLATGE